MPGVTSCSSHLFAATSASAASADRLHEARNVGGGMNKPAPWLDFRRPNTTFPSGPRMTAATPTRGWLFDDVAIADCLRGSAVDDDWMDLGMK